MLKIRKISEIITKFPVCSNNLVFYKFKFKSFRDYKSFNVSARYTIFF